MVDMAVCFGGVQGAIDHEVGITPNVINESYFEGHSGTSSMLFNASRSNSVYGSSNTVTPLSLSCKYIISY